MNKKPPKVVINTEGGLGNRIRGLISGLYLSQHLDRPLMVGWTADSACECEFQDLFEDEIEVFTDSKETHRKEFYEGLVDGPVEYYGKRFMEHPDLGSRAIIPETLLDLFDDAHIVYESPRLLEFIDREQRSALLQNLRVQPRLLRNIDEFCTSRGIGKNVYGVHIRETDHSRRDRNYYSRKIDKIIEKDSSARFFLCSDSKENEDFFAGKYPGRVIIKPKRNYVQKLDEDSVWVTGAKGQRPIYNVYRNRQSILEAMEDLLILTRTTFSIRSPGSFSDIVEWWSPGTRLSGNKSYQDERVNYYLKTQQYFTPKTERTRLETIVKAPLPHGVSIVTACMDRSTQLKIALESWRNCEEVSEIVVVDWSSEEPVHPWIRKLQDPRIIVARVVNERRWVLARAFNLAARLASAPMLCKMDADYVVSKDFFKVHHPRPGSFICGDHRKARNSNEKHLNGFLFLAKDDFFRCNGYNERIVVYGWEDKDIQKRLSESGLRRQPLNNDYIRHIPHDDGARSQRQPGLIDIQTTTQGNKRLSQKDPWKPTDAVTKFDVRAKGKNYFSCEAVRRERIPEQRRLYLKVEGNLANRLSALTSSMALAVRTRRQLILTWLPGDQCGCRFSDLFENDIPEINGYSDVGTTPNAEEYFVLSEYERVRNHRVRNSKHSAVFVHASWPLRSRRLRMYMEQVSMQQLCPNRHLRDRIRMLDLSETIGVHIPRAADPPFRNPNEDEYQSELLKRDKWQQRAHPSVFFSKIDQIIASDSAVRLFLYSEDEDIEQEFLSRYGKGRITLAKSEDRQWSREEMQLLNLYWLSQTRFVISGGLNSVADVVTRMGGGPVELAGQDF